MKITLDVTHVQLCKRKGREDVISLTLKDEANLAYPEMKYPPYFDLRVREGQGEKVLKDLLHVTPDEVIDLSTPDLKGKNAHDDLQRAPSLDRHDG